jgi:DNA-binding transcriptional LysR family regulator
VHVHRHFPRTLYGLPEQMLDPRRLRLLIQLESLGTVRAVAVAASMSPSAVSQQLAALERESGAALLERHGRAVALTDAGVALAAHARAILERIGAAEEDLRALRDAPAGTVRIASFTSAMRAFVITAAATAGRAHPGVAVHLAELEPDDCVPALTRGEVDLAVVADFGDGTLPHTPHLRSLTLATDELRAVLPPGRRARDATAGVKLEDLRDEPWLLDGTELERHVLRRCRRAGFEPRVVGRLFSHEALLYAVRSGLGVTVLPTFALDRADGVEVCPLDPVAPRELVVLHRVEALDRRSVALTLDVLVAAARAV